MRSNRIIKLLFNINKPTRLETRLFTKSGSIDILKSWQSLAIDRTHDNIHTAQNRNDIS
jgi:hypothetical protein